MGGAAKRARPANGLWLPAEKSATLNIYGFHTALHSCMLKEIGQRLEGKCIEMVCVGRMSGRDHARGTMQINRDINAAAVAAIGTNLIQQSGSHWLTLCERTVSIKFPCEVLG